jgi:uncharacterized protein (TIGR00290 family)
MLEPPILVPIKSLTEMKSIEAQVIGNNAQNAAVSWTGGKDCNLALLRAWRAAHLNVTCLVVFCPNEARFRAHPLEFMEAQAKELGLPLYRIVFSKDGTDYKQMYVDAIESLKNEHRIQVIVTGDMDLVGTMKRNWIQECCEAVSVDAYLPLWKENRETVLEAIINEGFQIMFSCVKTPYFDASWIGKTLNQESVDEMRQLTLTRYENVKPLDLGGENGEYHTMCIHGLLYRNPIKVNLGDPFELTGQQGQKEDEKWWVLNACLSPG